LITRPAQLELKALSAIAGAVELLPVGQRAHVVHGHLVSGLRLRAGSGLDGFDDEVGHGAHATRAAFPRQAAPSRMNPKNG
jgi:hypothetical protein